MKLRSPLTLHIHVQVITGILIKIYKLLDNRRLYFIIIIIYNYIIKYYYNLLFVFDCRGRGLIINVASAAGLSPTPLLSMYSGTKVCIYLLLITMYYLKF